MLRSIMPPRFLFLTGEPTTTLPLLKSRPAWSPVLSAITFDVSAGRLHRRGSATDDFRGCIYFADVRDHDIALHNQGVLAGSAIPCWPDPAALLAVADRHAAMARCLAAGLVEHLVLASGRGGLRFRTALPASQPNGPGVGRSDLPLRQEPAGPGRVRNGEFLAAPGRDFHGGWQR